MSAPAIVIPSFTSFVFAIEPASIALVIPVALTLKASEFISIEESSTPTLNAVPAPPAKPSPATEEFNWVAVIPASATFTPLPPTDNVEPSKSKATVAPPEPLKVKSAIPLPSTKLFANESADIPVKPDPSPENPADAVTSASTATEPEVITFCHVAIYSLFLNYYLLYIYSN